MYVQASNHLDSNYKHKDIIFWTIKKGISTAG